MNIEYLVSPRTAGANPFLIFESAQEVNQDKLCAIIRDMPYSDFLRSAYWFGISHTLKARVGMRCQVCNSARSISVHHRTYDTHGKEHLYMMDLVVLCKLCHGLFHGHASKDSMDFISDPLKPKVPIQLTPISLEPSIKLTRQMLAQMRTERNGFTNKTLQALGVSRADMSKGWIKNLNGKMISALDFQKAMEGKSIYGHKL